MLVSVHSGPAEVVAHGMVTCFATQPLSFLLDAGIPVRVEMVFATDPSLPDVHVDLQSEDDPHGNAVMRFRLANFDRPDGRGSAMPVLLGEVGSELLFFHFRVFRFGRTEDRTVHYTFYRVAKSAVGWKPAAR